MLNALRHQWFGRGRVFEVGQRLGRVRPCSTPYGISGLAEKNQDSWRAGVGLSVLNALRHQWFGSVSGNSGGVSFNCAQRLTASVVWQSKFMRSAISLYGCSTPYGISGLAAGFRLASRNRLAACSTPYGISGLADGANKQNAFSDDSAQRLTASVVWQIPEPVRGCSFPFGVVLNALRHQWFGRLPWQHHAASAASVLNALRHQWFGSCITSRYSCLMLTGCAQRLTASVVWQSRHPPQMP